MTKHDIARLFAYSTWANQLVLTAAESLSDEQLHRDFQTGHHSVLETFVHMVGAEWIWLERWESKPYSKLGGLEAPYNMNDATLSKVGAAWKAIDENRSKFLQSLSEEALQADLPYKNLRGESFSQPLVDQMEHVANHATHHRGQIVGFLRAFGVKPPTTDMIHYFRVVE